jgi:two-component system response regulator QseB
MVSFDSFSPAARARPRPAQATPLRVLLVDGDAVAAGALLDALEVGGFTVDHVGDGRAALASVGAVLYDVIILGLELADMPGEHALDALRARGCTVPLLVLSARAGVAVRIAVLDAGADDVLVKPCDMRELVARLRALARRPKEMLAARVACNNLSLSLERLEIAVDGKPLGLGRREFMLMAQLMRSAGRPVAKSQLHESLYGLGGEPCSNPIEVSVHRMRRRLREAGAAVRIESRRGVGYVLLPGGA